MLETDVKGDLVVDLVLDPPAGREVERAANAGRQPFPFSVLAHHQAMLRAAETALA